MGQNLGDNAPERDRILTLAHADPHDKIRTRKMALRSVSHDILTLNSSRARTSWGSESQTIPFFTGLTITWKLQKRR